MSLLEGVLYILASDHKRGRQEALGGDVDVKGNFFAVTLGEAGCSALSDLKFTPHGETEEESEDEGEEGLSYAKDPRNATNQSAAK